MSAGAPGDVGRAAAGVARDLHALLADLGRTSEDLLRTLPPEGRPHELARAAGRAGERAAALTRQLLTLTGHAADRPGAPDLNLLVAGLGEALLRLLGPAVQLTLVLDPGPKPVGGEAGPVEQIVVNLVREARDAMPAGGKLTLETGTVEVADNGPPPHPELRAGRYALLRVRDTGRGLDEKTRTRLLEVPDPGRGPDSAEGRGLPAVRRLVRQLGGVVAVYSEPELGTCYAVYLPAAAAAANAEPPPAHLTGPHASGREGFFGAMLRRWFGRRP